MGLNISFRICVIGLIYIYRILQCIVSYNACHLVVCVSVGLCD